VTPDLLRRRAGRRRSARFWDRGQWFAGVALAALLLGIGVWSLSTTWLGRPVLSTVRSCETELHLSGHFGRHVTYCEVLLPGTHAPAVDRVETRGPLPPGSSLALTEFRNTYSDASLSSSYAWLVPLGLAVAVLAWWMGLPPKTDLSYGRHTRPRSGR
jgi:hypothetical protein